MHHAMRADLTCKKCKPKSVSSATVRAATGVGEARAQLASSNKIETIQRELHEVGERFWNSFLPECVVAPRDMEDVWHPKYEFECGKRHAQEKPTRS